MAEDSALQLTERKWKMPLLIFFRDARLIFKMDELGSEILRIAVPAAMALAADPIASLIDTAFVGHLGPVEIAAVGVSIAIFNQASKVTIFPLAIFLIFCAKPLLSIMGVKSGSPMLTPARKYLTLRSLGSPAVLLSLAMQGVFRGFKDTKTPLYATVIGDVANIILDPIFIFVCRLGVSGAAIAHVLSQYLISLILLWRLMKKIDLLPPSLKDLQFGRFLKNGFLLLARVIAATICVTLAASRAARLGSTTMAAFQVCLQVWLTSSLLADGLAVAGQAIIACAFAEKDYQKATTAGTRVLQMSFVLGLGLAVVVGLGLHFGDGIFSKDPNVLYIISIGIPFVAATQPINSIAFVFDGVNFGASDFAYSAYSMVSVLALFQTTNEAESSGSYSKHCNHFFLSKTGGFVGIWIALTIFMGLRTFAGVWRMGTGTGPWSFLRGRMLP
ncbi:hypothetical protein GH714_003133 [Hevea brasiliensis]|uniref:Multidrug and toxic compound extrusion protein n=1 Tax=Hevea brasiliensis TaxID=3981 RepID=A0A6A6KX53_HEVBR|nr:hypothetical protein GH714_003133 [Hevea brasiliensis]